MHQVESHFPAPQPPEQQGLEPLVVSLPRGSIPAPELPVLSARAFDSLRFHCEERAQTAELDTYINQGVFALPRMQETCRLSVCMGVAAHEEERAIVPTLEALKKQHLASDAYEVVLFLNHPATKDGNTVVPDGTIPLVHAFMAENPSIPIVPFYLTLPEPDATIGLVRRIVNDVVIRRYCMRGPGFPDHVLLQQDADICNMHPRLMAQALGRFARHPEAAAIQGPVDFDWRASLEDPILLIGQRLMHAIDAYRASHDEEFVPSHGQNIAVRASCYARVQGHNPKLTEGENNALAFSIDSLRRAEAAILGKHDPGIIPGGPKMRVWMSPRRGAAALRENSSAFIEQWGDGNAKFALHDAGVRRRELRTDVESFMRLLESSDFNERLSDCISRNMQYLRRFGHPHVEVLAESILAGRFGLRFNWTADGARVEVTDSGALQDYCRTFARHADGYYRKRLGLD